MSNDTKIRYVKRLPMPEIGHWHFEFILKPAYHRLGVMHLSLGFFKLLAIPPEGEMVQPFHYKGVWLRHDFVLPEFGFARNWSSWQEMKEKLQISYGSISPCCKAPTRAREFDGKAECSKCDRKLQ